MRVVIKNADFSGNSIGKVGRDYSFTAVGNRPDGIKLYENWALNGQGTAYVISTKLYVIDTSGDDDLVLFDNTEDRSRLLTGFIEVIPGMTIARNNMPSINFISDGITIPYLVCFDENKQLLADAESYATYIPIGGTIVNRDFTIPAGVKYVRCQTAISNDSGTNIVSGNMPSE